MSPSSRSGARRRRGPQWGLVRAAALSAALLGVGIVVGVLAFLAMGAGASPTVIVPAATVSPSPLLHVTCLAGTDRCRVEFCTGATCLPLTPPPTP